MAHLLPKSRRAWTTVAAVVLVGVAALLAYRWLRPADQVFVLVTNVDPATRFLWLVADTAAGPETMGWSRKKVVPSTTHPSRMGPNFDPRYDRGSTYLSVSWRDGRRYGLLTEDRDGRWRVFWLAPEDVHLMGRLWLLGGGEAWVRMPPKDRAEPASEELLDQLGFGPEVRERWREGT